MKKIIIISLLLFSSIANAQTKDDILKYHFEKMGMPEKWLTINTIKQTSINIYDNSFFSPVTSTQIQFIKKPTFVRYESKNMTKGSIILLCADSLGTWQKINKGEVTRISKYGIDFIQANMTIFIASELENKENIQLKPNETINGREYYVLDVKNNKVIRRLLYLNTKTYMIDMFVSINPTDGSKIDNAAITYLSDYKNIQGFLFPFQSEIIDYKTKRITTDIQINIPIDDKIFSPEKE